MRVSGTAETRRTDTVGEFIALPPTGGKNGLCGPGSPLSSEIPDGSRGNIERTLNSPTVSNVVGPRRCHSVTGYWLKPRDALQRVCLLRNHRRLFFLTS